MIEKLIIHGTCYGIEYPNIEDIVDKINEIIDCLNKLQTITEECGQCPDRGDSNDI